jgi:hypothetical protein
MIVVDERRRSADAADSAEEPPMCPRPALWFAVALFAAEGFAAEPDPELVNAEKTLQEAKVETDGASLLRFFRERTLTEADITRLGDAVRRLGDDDFETREKAADELIHAGRKALPFLNAARRDKDPERARHVAECIKQIDNRIDVARILAAARLLHDRRPAGAAPVLLAYLPAADDAEVEDAVLRALLAVGMTGGEPDLTLVKALTDKEPLRRAAAGYVLGRADPGRGAAVRRLLTDAEPRVRFETAVALARAGDKESVPALIALLADGPMSLGWRAQETLYRIAGDKSPGAPGGKRTSGRPSWRASTSTKRYRASTSSATKCTAAASGPAAPTANRSGRSGASAPGTRNSSPTAVSSSASTAAARSPNATWKGRSCGRTV